MRSEKDQMYRLTTHGKNLVLKRVIDNWDDYFPKWCLLQHYVSIEKFCEVLFQSIKNHIILDRKNLENKLLGKIILALKKNDFLKKKIDKKLHLKKDN
ncbi:hypothetical protein BpHYR1_045696 [Brachionus plicatilis]|uniref:Uncharacterized protein n=1 Tax=Brachionus plicatilis TaxID=10195 RepID=A0A3M7SPG0_BRAPC|nr:hypothetical protein BpHYR1_045696 [Brachionus plicatilis]